MEASEQASNRHIGIREFRTNLSRHLQRVKDGETLTITEHGRPVAEISAARPDPQTIWEQWIAEGKIIPPKGRWEDRPPLLPGDGTNRASQILQELREDRL